MEQKHLDLLNSKEFKRLVKKRAIFCISGAIFIAFVYFGFMLFIAFNKKFMATIISDSLTISIPIGIGIILLAWIMTGVYLYWANNTYDAEVKNLINKLKD